MRSSIVSTSGNNVAAVTISQNFIAHVGQIYTRSLESLLERDSFRHGINGLAYDGLSAYILSVAAVEAAINEMYLGPIARMMAADSTLWKFDKTWVEKLGIAQKLIFVPEMLFGRTFDTGTQPYQDVLLLIKVRNDLVHFRMSFSKPSYFEHMENRKIIIKAKGDADFPLASKLNCTEGIRWAHNTACKTVQFLSAFADSRFPGVNELASANFKVISDDYVRAWFTARGKDPDIDESPRRAG